MTAEHIVLVAALVCTALATGTFYGWQVSVIPGTRQVDDHAYIQTMQHINLRIINPGFLVPFLVTPLLLGAAAVLSYRSGNMRRSAALTAAAVVYVVGVLGVTAGRNVPLNNSLAALDVDASSATELASTRRAYEQPWNRWHAVRTAAGVVAFAIAAVAPLVSTDEG
jgi:uncharacterized membrane protein